MDAGVEAVNGLYFGSRVDGVMMTGGAHGFAHTHLESSLLACEFGCVGSHIHVARTSTQDTDDVFEECETNFTTLLTWIIGTVAFHFALICERMFGPRVAGVVLSTV